MQCLNILNMQDDLVSPMHLKFHLFSFPIYQFSWMMEDLNAKGVTLKALNQIRLKTCIDFKPRDSEDSYISVVKLNGYVW